MPREGTIDCVAGLVWSGVARIVAGILVPCAACKAGKNKDEREEQCKQLFHFFSSVFVVFVISDNPK